MQHILKWDTTTEAVCEADMKKGSDMRTLNTEILADSEYYVSMWLHFIQVCCRNLKDFGGVRYLMQYL